MDAVSPFSPGNESLCVDQPTYQSFTSVSDTSASWFEVSSQDSFPFSPDVINDLLKRRESLRGSLFFDHMLVLAGIDLGVFPPWSLDDLAVLVQEIDNCEWQDLRKDCMSPLGLLDHLSLYLMTLAL
jgi:hypothetical protein